MSRYSEILKENSANSTMKASTQMGLQRSVGRSFKLSTAISSPGMTRRRFTDRRRRIRHRWRWVSKPVAHFDDVQVHTQGIRSIQTCIGEVVKSESRKCVRDRMDLKCGGPHELDVTPDVLRAVFVPT
jgi:hypothetical protein